MSIISSGSAAFSIQSYFKKYNLPNLKALIDIGINKRIEQSLKNIGCEIYKTNLRKRELSWKDILKITKNINGIDITSLTSHWSIDQATSFYDTLSYEILNNSPDYCFIPFGSGNLYENILSVNITEIKKDDHDKRFFGDVNKLKKCNFIGATTNNPKSKADKLYSAHSPFRNFNEHIIRLYKYAGYCGPESNLHIIQEKFLDVAMKIANSQGINCEPSGIAGLALMLQMKDKIPKNKKILIINTGKTRYTK